MKILIFGNKGYIGSEFVRQMLNYRSFDVCSLPSRGFDGNGYTHKKLDFLIDKMDPNVVINAAAYTGGSSGIVGCQKRQDLAITSNLIFPKMIGEICGERDIVFCHISTGCLYTGYPTGGFTELDSPNMTFENGNCSFYTGTKVMAEQSLESVKKKYIWRIRLPFDEFDCSKNYITKILNYKQLISVKNSISHKGDFVKACIETFHRGVCYGTYNMTNPGSMDAREIVELMYKHMNLKELMPNKSFEFLDDPNALGDIPRSNTILNTDKLQKTGIKIRPIEEAMLESIKNWNKGSPA